MFYRCGPFYIHRLLIIGRASVNSCSFVIFVEVQCLMHISVFDVEAAAGSTEFMCWLWRQAQPWNTLSHALQSSAVSHFPVVFVGTGHPELMTRIHIDRITQVYDPKKCGGRLSIHPLMCLQCVSDMHVKAQPMVCAHIPQSMMTATVWFTHMTSIGHSRF